MKRRTDIVVTTIFEPAWLSGYLDNLRQHGRDAETTIRIICDRKTPNSVYVAARKAATQGFQVDCPSLVEQEAWLSRIGAPEGLIPWNTDNRRNLGFLRALESGADVLISIDDDNYCQADSDFVGDHLVVGSVPEAGNLLSAEGGNWFNICGLLDFGMQEPVFARGFPYAEREDGKLASCRELTRAQARRIAINAGLWLDDPDVDAVTRLSMRPKAQIASSKSVLMGPDTWSPINTQNTALIREAIPAYYYVRMGFALQGLSIDRFGDILSGYFVQKIAKHQGDAVRIGSPVARHRRSPHNLFKDLYHELAGIVLIEDLLPWLREVRLEGEGYPAAYACLADALISEADHFQGFIWDQGGREFLKETAECMQTWLRVIRRLEG